MVYTNIFSGLKRKFENGVGYASSDGGVTWVKNNTPEGLIKNLPYYKA
ncbi:hypothetical protein [Escherichia phage vB_EcoM_JNE01]|nr:hypothetical protein [Escherichia phage vB_EcoM_JNE01]